MCVFLFSASTAYNYALSLHDALPISRVPSRAPARRIVGGAREGGAVSVRPVTNGLGSELREARLQRGLTLEQVRSEEHTSELQSQSKLVCRLLLEKQQRCLQWSSFQS